MITSPLVVSANRRYLTVNGTPFHLNCCQTWLATTRSTRAQWGTYLAAARANGFNASTLMLIVSDGFASIGTGNEPANKQGQVPFTTSGNFSTTNNAYFDYIEQLISDARDANMYVFLFYTYWGYGGQPGQGWWNEINSNSTTVCTNWGAYIGNRFKTYANIILGNGGDYSVAAGTGTTHSVAILNGIRSAGGFAAQWPSGSEWNNPDTIATSQVGFTYGPDPAVSNQQLGTFYGYGAGFDGLVYVTARSVWADSTVLPGVMQEPGYYLEEYVSGDRTSERMYHYWALLSGSNAGQCWGAKYLWYWQTTGSPQWDSILSSDAWADIGRLFGLCATPGISWWRHAPSAAPGFTGCGRTLVVSGGGSDASTVASSIDASGYSMLVYNPSTGTSAVTYSVDPRGMAGKYRARWYNPTTAVFANIAGGGYTFDNTVASQSFTTPGNNGASANDWVLVLDVQQNINPPIFVGMMSLP